MNKKKLEEYNLTGSIHTLSIKSPGIVEDIQEDVSNCIVSSSRHDPKETTTTSTINPNKLVGNIFSYSEFETVFNTILSGKSEITLLSVFKRLKTNGDTESLSFAALDFSLNLSIGIA